jgi:hypothetical protein
MVNLPFHFYAKNTVCLLLFVIRNTVVPILLKRPFAPKRFSTILFCVVISKALNGSSRTRISQRAYTARASA